jgi:hypothetical protein
MATRPYGAAFRRILERRRHQERAMPKGVQRSNKEKRKPKQQEKKAPPAPGGWKTAPLKPK